MAASTVISNEEWEGQRENITKLYGEQEWPLKQVIKKLRTKDFNPTEAQVRSKLKKWKVIKPHRQTRKKHFLGSEGKPTSKSRFPTRPDPPVKEKETLSSPQEDDSPVNQDPQSTSANWTPPPWSISSDPQSKPMPSYNFNIPVDNWHGSSFAAQQQGRHHYTSVEVQADGISSSSPMHALHPPLSVWPSSQSNWAPSVESPLSPFYNPPPNLLPYSDGAGSLHTWEASNIEASNIEASHSRVYPQQSQPLNDIALSQKAPLLNDVTYSHGPQNVDPSYPHPSQFSPMPSQNEISASPSTEPCFWPENLIEVKQLIHWRSSNEISQSSSRVNRRPRRRHSGIPNDRKLKAEVHRSNRYEGVYGSPIGLHRQSQAPPSQEVDARDLNPNQYQINYTYPAVLQTAPVPTNFKYTQPQTQSYPVWPQMQGSPVPLPQAQPYQNHPPTMY